MKIFTIFFSFSLILMQSCVDRQHTAEVDESTNVNEVRQIIEAKNEQISNWYAQGQIDSVANNFASYAIQMPPNMTPLRGRQQFIETWKQNVQVGKWEFSLNTEDLKVCGNLATELGSYTLDFIAQENSPIPSMSDQGNYVVLWEKIDGDWKIVWDAPVSERPLAFPVADSTIVH